jgi:YqaJ-like viral recombinase domain
MAVSCQQFGLARKQTSVRRTGFRDLVASMSPNHTAVALMCYNAVKPVKPHELLYIDRAKTEYLKSASSPIDSGSHFLKDFKSRATFDICKEISELTRNQSENQEWHQYRTCRITATKLYEAAQCQTSDRSLTGLIMNGKVIHPTKAMSRGLQLENDILNSLSQKYKERISKSGFRIFEENPIFGASPDGVSQDFVFEIKCPSKNETIKNYVLDGIIRPKYLAQISLQMKLCKKQKGIFCIASPSFEEDQQLECYPVDLDETFLLELMTKAEKFWVDNIYPKILIPLSLRKL